MDTGQLIPLGSVIVAAIVAVAGMLFAERRHREQMKTERESREAELERERKRWDDTREYIPRFEFLLELGLIREQESRTLVEFLIVLNNKGNVEKNIKSIKLRLRAIKTGEELRFWEGRGNRLAFPHKVLETEIIPEGYGFVFVEPSVRQVINYTTVIDNDISLVAARAEFSYGRARKDSRGSKHSVERVFALRG